MPEMDTNMYAEKLRKTFGYLSSIPANNQSLQENLVIILN
jgi:hypothetical protein